MIDAVTTSKIHGDLLQSVESIKIAYAKALLVDYDRLKVAQSQNDVAGGQSILQEALEPMSGHWSKSLFTEKVEPWMLLKLTAISIFVIN